MSPPPSSAPPPPPRESSGSNRGALLSSIEKGTKLKKSTTNDRSAPVIDGSSKRGQVSSIGNASNSKSSFHHDEKGKGREEESHSSSKSINSGSGLFQNGFPKLKPISKKENQNSSPTKRNVSISTGNENGNKNPPLPPPTSPRKSSVPSSSSNLKHQSSSIFSSSIENAQRRASAAPIVANKNRNNLPVSLNSSNISSRPNVTNSNVNERISESSNSIKSLLKQDEKVGKESFSIPSLKEVANLKAVKSSKNINQEFSKMNLNSPNSSSSPTQSPRPSVSNLKKSFGSGNFPPSFSERNSFNATEQDGEGNEGIDDLIRNKNLNNLERGNFNSSSNVKNHSSPQPSSFTLPLKNSKTFGNGLVNNGSNSKSPAARWIFPSDDTILPHPPRQFSNSIKLFTSGSMSGETVYNDSDVNGNGINRGTNNLTSTINSNSNANRNEFNPIKAIKSKKSTLESTLSSAIANQDFELCIKIKEKLKVK